jgi:hypothetical protein
MVREKAVRRKDAGLFTSACVACKRHVKVATDAVAGGYSRSLEHATPRANKACKHQCEELNQTETTYHLTNLKLVFNSMVL